MVPKEVKFPGATLLITSEAIHVLSLFPMPALSHAVLHWMGCTASASLCSWGPKIHDYHSQSIHSFTQLFRRSSVISKQKMMDNKAFTSKWTSVKFFMTSSQLPGDRVSHSYVSLLQSFVLIQFNFVMCKPVMLFKGQRHISICSDNSPIYRCLLNRIPLPPSLIDHHFHPSLVYPCPLWSLHTSVIKAVLFSDLWETCLSLPEDWKSLDRGEHVWFVTKMMYLPQA